MIYVAISGGFDPPHTGHTRHFKGAVAECKRLGGALLIILTRDDQLIEKKGWVYMPYEEREEVLNWNFEGKGVLYKVVPNVDPDITSRESIRKYKPSCFLKGGDTWDEKNLPEYEVCKELGVRILFGVGGYDKLRSSSALKPEMRNNV